MIRGFSKNHHAIRNEKVRSKMSENGLDAVVFAKMETVRYITGYRRWYTYSWFYLREFAVVSANPGPILLVDKGRIKRAERTCYIDEVRNSYLWPIPIENVDAPFEALCSVLRDLGVEKGRIGLEFDFFPIDFFNGLAARLPKANFIDFSRIMNEIVSIKFGEEIEAVREVVRLADIGLYAGAKAAKPGNTEQDIAAAVDFAMMDAGAERVSHNVVRTGNNVMELNNIQTDRIIKEGDQIQMDLGAVTAGYFSDVNYTYILGKKSQEQEKIESVAFAMEKNAIAAIKPGVNTSELRAIMENTASQGGFQDYISKDIGHGIGIYHQEYPKIAEDNCTLKPGMILCIEPGIIVPGVSAARIEEMVLVTEDGFENLSNFNPREID